MSVRYSDGAKTFIGVILVGTVALIALTVFMLFGPERKPQYTPPEKKVFTCSESDYIGYVHDDTIGERMEELMQRKYEVYCIKKTGVRQWSIYAR